MAATQIGAVLQHLRRAAAVRDARNALDQQLLERFVRLRDEASFDALVRRYGPLVLGVCRRVLHNWHDAEDVFQATFLVLARKAHSAGKRATLGTWLHQVAYHMALKASKQAKNRRKREERAGVADGPSDPLAEVCGRELLAAFDDELQHLPERYKAPLVLCYLEGKTRDEAARQLGCSESTLKRRLEQAKARMRTRLAKRGVALPEALLATGLAASASSAAVPSTLTASTVQAGTLVTAGKGVAGVASTTVAALVKGSLQTMALGKLKSVGALLLAGSLVSAGTGFLAYKHYLSLPAALANQSPAQPVPNPEKEQAPAAKSVTLRGRCVDHVDDSAMVGAEVRVFKVQGRTSPIVEIAKTVSDRDGRFAFPGLVPPRADDPVDPLFYLLFAEAENRPIGVGGRWTMREHDADNMTIRFLREKVILSGKVADARGNPVAGAAVAQWAIDGRPVPGILSATSRPDGRFAINRIPKFDRSSSWAFTVSHPGYPQTLLQVRDLPRNVTVTLPTGSKVKGTVVDSVTGRPAAAVVVAERLGEYSEIPASTDAAGRFAMVLPEDRYNFFVRAKDRVCIAIRDRECLAGQQVELPLLKLINGGFISGRVVNAGTGQSISVTREGEPIAMGLFGPSQPVPGKAVSPQRMATVDRAGRYIVRAAPGENFPYFVNCHGDRMAWNTTNGPAVVVKEGETTAYDMVVTPPTPPEEKLKAARKLVESLPVKPADRTARILLELRKFDHTVDETELWCTLIRELVIIGRDAIPLLCAELDRTTENRMLRRLGFSLRAINDPRAVPALIRAIPKTLLPSSSDYGLIVADPSLAEFMQKHDLVGRQRGGQYFDFGRPEREVIGALQKLTGHAFADSQLFGLGRSDDPRRQLLQRRLLTRQAQRWQTWWEAHGREFTADPAYQRVNLQVDDKPLPPASMSLGPKARFEEEIGGATLSPAIQEGKYATHFYDLDTGSHPKWPADIPKDEARIDQKKLADWAKQSGADLMCVTHRAPDGKETFVLKSFGMKCWEISQQDLRNINKLIAAGTLPKGHAVGDLLMHYDTGTKQSVPDANAAFVFVTREGSLGLIETTDRVTRTANLTGGIGAPPAGVGFFKGVRFNLKWIIR